MPISIPGAGPDQNDGRGVGTSDVAVELAGTRSASGSLVMTAQQIAYTIAQFATTARHRVSQNRGRRQRWH
ncbi:hypothetical protein [Mycolicibacterium peregrinum]|uniref:Uncharacterized protein n=1 Tax=Mycolicibacterium peregrinum TaxID=43304 RepID=A0A4Z0HXQ4_MYCPR|nr:hypothetical protein [Mycolicibacterium peregrinum]TGB44647.1 hypothetical protein EJD94_09035 [Mycolicibacterium peregrinum]TGB46942.1 hypothetical protein EJD98_03465 [Mycolicibacterium peregrinum]